MVFITLWTLLIYSPIAHWVWHPNGWIFALGALDFAGGTVVHINAGVAGLVGGASCSASASATAHDNMAPYNLGLAVIGAAPAVGGLVRLQRRLGGRRAAGAPAWRCW